MKKKYYKELFNDTMDILSMVSSISKSFLPFIILKNLIQATLPFINILFSYFILDGIVEIDPKEIIFFSVYWLIGLNLVLGILLSILTKYINVKTDYVNRSINAKIAYKALTLDYEQLEKQESLILLHKAKEGATSNGDFMSYCNNLGTMLSNLISIIYSVILLFSLFAITPSKNDSAIEHIMNSPLTVIVLFVVYGIALFINYRFVKKMNVEFYKFFEKNVDNNRKFFYFMQLANNYQFGKDIRLYQMSGLIEEEMNKANDPAAKTMNDLGKLNGKYIGLTEIVNQVAVFATYAFVGIKAILGLISIGNILKYVSALMNFISSISGLIGNFAYFDLQSQYLINYCMFLKLENKKYQGTLPIEKRDDNEYEIEFRNVSFHYPNSEDLILKNVSLKLKVGRKMAIVGKNGAGKTTFIKLLCRLYDPTDGEILLNGINIKKYDYNEYLKIFSVVFQDFKLFSFDIGQNVAASTDVDEQKVWDMLSLAGIGNRVKNMDDGLRTNLYQTQENGVEISGGEAQKIAIARALYKDAPLVILDEPTSALDPLSEYEIYARFDQLVSDKTSIYISHRMSSCRFCDNIVVFDSGQIAQLGSHDSLMKEEDGLYHALWSAQAKYYTM
jgi:ATP-binding cassette, subfamily B, bacterial